MKELLMILPRANHVGLSFFFLNFDLSSLLLFLFLSEVIYTMIMCAYTYFGCITHWGHTLNFRIRDSKQWNFEAYE